MEVLRMVSCTYVIMTTIQSRASVRGVFQGPGSDEVFVGDEAAKTHSWGTKPHSWGIFTLFFTFRLDFTMEADGSR